MSATVVGAGSSPANTATRSLMASRCPSPHRCSGGRPASRTVNDSPSADRARLGCRDVDVEWHHDLIRCDSGQIDRRQESARGVGDLDEPGPEDPPVQWMSPRSRLAVNPEGTGIGRPVLVLVPTNVISTWQAECGPGQGRLFASGGICVQWLSPSAVPDAPRDVARTLTDRSPYHIRVAVNGSAGRCSSPRVASGCGQRTSPLQPRVGACDPVRLYRNLACDVTCRTPITGNRFALAPHARREHVRVCAVVTGRAVNCSISRGPHPRGPSAECRTRLPGRLP